MPQQDNNCKRKSRGDTRFPGICRHARALGVSRVTLWRVLTGAWDLPKLKARYNTLCSTENSAA